MNNTQLKHFRERLRQIYSNKKMAVTHQFGYTTEQKDQLFKEARYTVEGNNGYYKVVWDGEDKVKAEAKKLLEKIEQEYNSILDKAILGDTEEALKALENFKNS